MKILLVIASMALLCFASDKPVDMVGGGKKDKVYEAKIAETATLRGTLTKNTETKVVTGQSAKKGEKND
jgi:hypothetical protein